MRVCKASGYRSLKFAAQHFFALTAIQPPLLLPSNLDLFSERCELVLGDSGNIISRNTIAPALLPFLSESARQSLITHLKGTGNTKNPFMYLGFANASTKSGLRQFFCLRCVEEDLDVVGWPYWRRYHQFPLMSLCPRHRIPLTAGCNECKFSEPTARYIKQPRLQCWCGKPNAPFYPKLQSKRALQAASRVTSVLHELLEFPLDLSFTREIIGLTYRKALAETDMQRGSHLAVSALEGHFESHFTDEFLLSCGSSVSGDRSWLANTLALREVPSSVIRNALLIDFFFGGVGTFKEALAQLGPDEARSYSSEGVKRKSKANPLSNTKADSERRQLYRQTLSDFLIATPETSRTVFQNAHGAKASWLRNHDSGWYNKTLPPRPKVGGRSKDERARYFSAMDESLAEHVKSRVRNFNNEEMRPRRMTQRSLLKGHSRANEFDKLKEHLPKTLSCLSETIESAVEYKHRLALWISTHPSGVPAEIDPIKYASQSTGLSIQKITDLLNTSTKRFCK